MHMLFLEVIIYTRLLTFYHKLERNLLGMLNLLYFIENHLMHSVKVTLLRNLLAE